MTTLNPPQPFSGREELGWGKPLVHLANSPFIKNVTYSLFTRIGSVGLSFLSVSISLAYLGNQAYGIWVTLSSLLAWVNFFDFGLANSLQSQLAQAVATNKLDYARVLVSTSYAVMLRYIVPVLLLTVIGVAFSMNWSSVLHTEASAETSVKWAIALLGCCTTLQLTLKPVSTILFAYQKTRLNELVVFFIQLLIVLLIVALNYFSPAWMNPFTGVVLINALIPVIVWSGVSVYVYTRLHPELIPAIQHIDWTQTRTLLQVGLSFTVLQLYGIAIFFTDNILIAYLFGAESVTEYSIINKYFSVLTLFFGMILMPYWSAIAVTYAKNDTKGTLKLIRVVLVAFLALSIGGIVLFVMKDYAVRLWTKLDVSAYFYLSVWVLLSTLLAMFNNIYTILLNSANKLRLQVVMAILVIILNPVLSIVAVKVLHYPIEAIPIVNVFCMFLFGLMAYIQATKVMQNRAVGIWNK